MKGCCHSSHFGDTLTKWQVLCWPPWPGRDLIGSTEDVVAPVPFPCQRTWVNPVLISRAMNVLLRDWFQVRHRYTHSQEGRSY